MLLNRPTRPDSVISRAVKRTDLRGLHRQLLISPTSSSSYINGESIQQLREPAAEQQSEWPTHSLSLIPFLLAFFIRILLFLLSFCSLNFLGFSLCLFMHRFFPIHFTMKSAGGKPILAVRFYLNFRSIFIFFLSIFLYPFTFK
jgi:hypothetical protein